jgi:hypothetical protein
VGAADVSHPRGLTRHAVHEQGSFRTPKGTTLLTGALPRTREGENLGNALRRVSALPLQPRALSALSACSENTAAGRKSFSGHAYKRKAVETRPLGVLC